jgi:hypothetical protein
MIDYSGVLEELKDKRRALENERRELEALIAHVERLLAHQGDSSALRGSIIRAAQTALGELSMPDAIRVYFASLPHPEPKTTREIQDGLRAGGYQGGKSVRSQVYNALHRLSQGDGPLMRTSDRRWALREWAMDRGNRMLDELLAK